MSFEPYAVYPFGRKRLYPGGVAGFERKVKIRAIQSRHELLRVEEGS